MIPFKSIKHICTSCKINIGSHIHNPFSFQIQPRSIAEISGLKLDDALVRINGVEAAEMSYEEAVREIEKGGDTFDMTIER